MICLHCRPGASGRPGGAPCTCPLICTCPTTRPRVFPECDHCLRAVVQLWPPQHYQAAIRAYPRLAHQLVDWTLRIPDAARLRMSLVTDIDGARNHGLAAS